MSRAHLSAIAAAAAVTVAGQAMGQYVVNENFNSGPFVSPVTFQNGTDAGGNPVLTNNVSIAGTGWGLDVGGQQNNDPQVLGVATPSNTSVEVQNTFPTNNGWLFGGAIGDTNGDLTINNLDFSSTESAIGFHTTSAGDAKNILYSGSNTAGRTVGYWRVQYDAEMWMTRSLDRAGQIDRVALNPANGNPSAAHDFAGSTSNIFIAPAAATTYSGTGVQVVNATQTANYFIDGNDPANSQRDITSGVLARPVAAGDALNLNFYGRANNSITILKNGANANISNRNVGLGIDNVRLLAVSPGDLNADGTVEVVEAFTTVNNIGGAGDYTAGDGDGDGTIDVFEAFTAVNNIGAYASTTAGADSDGKLTVVYDPSTGALTVEDLGGTGAKSLLLTLETDTNSNPGSNPSAIASFDTSKAVIPGGSALLANTTKQLSWANFAGTALIADGGSIGLAGYLTTGLTQAQLEGNLTVLYGRPGQTGNLVGDVSVIPEPASMAVVGLAGAYLVRRRRAA